MAMMSLSLPMSLVEFDLALEAVSLEDRQTSLDVGAAGLEAIVIQQFLQSAALLP